MRFSEISNLFQILIVLRRNKRRSVILYSNRQPVLMRKSNYELLISYEDWDVTRLYENI